MLDLKIINGRVIDWKNDLDVICDIGIKDGKIVEIGNTDCFAAKQTIDAENCIVVPGIIDSHMHASFWLGGPMSYKMLAKAGVTTAMEMAGPIDSVKSFIKENGSGISIACLEQLRPHKNISSDSPKNNEIETAVKRALEDGAFGVKLLGGHYPFTPDASGRLIELCAKQNIYLAIHAGTTTQGSNINGMRQIVELANGNSFHLAHINAYCRGNVKDILDEISEAKDLLIQHPEIDSESYLSPINGCSGKCTDGIPESGVTKNCLKSKGYPVTEIGLKQAIVDGYAKVHKFTEDGVLLSDCSEGLDLWLNKETDVPISFSVNPSLSLFYFAWSRRSNKSFLVDSFCTDGGGIPRNVIIANGLSLVKFGALTLKEFVFKSSYSAACLMGLKNKGHLSVGADADITVIDYQSQKPIHAFSYGKAVLFNEKVVGEKGRIITTPQGEKSVKQSGLDCITVNIEELMAYRQTRFNNV